MRHSSRFCPEGKSTVEDARETARTLAQEGQTGREVLVGGSGGWREGGRTEEHFCGGWVWFGVVVWRGDLKREKCVCGGD